VALWIVAILALLVAGVALSTARRLARRLDALNQSYWELRYDYTRLRSQVAQINPEQAEETGGDAAPQQAPAAGVTFVPLSAIRKKD
jgi:acyl carrier protein phosphodiesterase